jgi:uncharacterized membrane protein YfcA
MVMEIGFETPLLNIPLLATLFFAVALLYSSVGHAGASGYLAAMALIGIAPAIMKPTALMLNILVAAIATARFYRAGCFSWRLFWPFACTSIPFAFLGGAITLPIHLFKPIVGLVLFWAAYKLFRIDISTTQNPTIKTAPLPISLFSGAAIGFVSGLTGTGGGIFLSPLLVLKRWAEIRTISGVSAAFILCNSVAALLGNFSNAGRLPVSTMIYVPCVVAGALLGSKLGAKRLAGPNLRKLLAIVLVIAGFKLILTH